MPQLMPIYWIMSILMLLLLLFVAMKIYGNYINKKFMCEMKLYNMKSQWYW